MLNHVISSTISIEPRDPRTDLDAWDDLIVELDQALRDASAARLAIDQEETTLERIEAGHISTIEGGNAETRKARLTLALADDARYQSHLQSLTEARRKAFDADRRVTVTKERCRLMRTSLSVSALADDT